MPLGSDAHVEDVEGILGSGDELAEFLLGLAERARVIASLLGVLVLVLLLSLRAGGRSERSEERTRGEIPCECASAGQLIHGNSGGKARDAR